MIELKQIYRVYRTDTVETTALNAVCLEIVDKEFVSIMGPSGCGKSSLLGVLGMLDNPTSGEYLFKGKDIARAQESELLKLRRDNIGFVFQSFNLIDELTVHENVEIALQYKNLSSKERNERVKAAMSKMKIDHRADHMPSQLSGGEQQRVAIARAVSGNPALILADEPTGNLDSKIGGEVMDLLAQLNEEGTTIAMVTHSPTHAHYSSRTINLLDGQIV